MEERSGSFRKKVEYEFFRPLILIGFYSQIGGAFVILLVASLLKDFITFGFFVHMIITVVLLVIGAIGFKFWSSAEEVHKDLCGLLRFLGIKKKLVHRENARKVTYHQRQTWIFNGLFCLALVDLFVVTALDLQSGGVWGSPFTPMLPAIAAVGSILLLPRFQSSLLYILVLGLLFVGFQNMPFHDIQKNWGYFSAEPVLPLYESIEDLAKESDSGVSRGEEYYKQGSIPKEHYEMVRRRYEKQRWWWIWAISVVALFSGIVSLLSAFQAGTRLKYFFQRDYIEPPVLGTNLSRKDKQTLTELVYDAENVFNQVFMSIPFMGKYSPYLSKVHDVDEVRNQAYLLAIPALHGTSANRSGVEARDIALTTFAVHWIDDWFDAQRFAEKAGTDVTAAWNTLYSFRYTDCRRIMAIDHTLHQREEGCPLEELFEVICMCSNDDKKTDRAIKRILYGALIQHTVGPVVRSELLEELRTFVIKGLKPELSRAVGSLSQGELWLTCKSVMELLHACEQPPPSLDVSEICNFFFAPLVGYSDKDQELGIEKAGDAWNLVNGVQAPVINLLSNFKLLYIDILRNDPRKKRRIEQMLAVYEYYYVHANLPPDVQEMYTDIVADIKAKARSI